MNKFFKRLALLLAVLMIVSMMPVQLFADNSVTGEGQSNGTTQNKAVASYELNGKTISFEGKTIREVNTEMRKYWEVDDANGCSYNADKLPADGTGALTWTIYGTVGQGEYLKSGALILPALSGGYIYKDGTYQWQNIIVVAGDKNATIVSNDTFDVDHIYVSNGANTTTTFTGITLDGSLYVVPNGTVTFDGCVFKGMLRVPNGNGFVKVANCQFVGDADEDSKGTKNEYPFFFQAGGTLEFIGNTIAANTYKRGLNVGGLKGLNATIENNTIGAVTAGYSAIQLSGKVTEAKIKGNEISLYGTNAFTLHESLISANKVTKVTVEGNKITGNGYLIYDDAVANSKAFTSENLKLTIDTNTVASTVYTTQGVKGSNKYGISETVATVVKEALTTVATVNGVGYATLADAIAAANGNGTVTLLTATTELVQALLDGQYGSIDGLTIELPAGGYGKLELGRATKYAGSNTEYFVGGFDSTDKNYKAFTNADEIRVYKGQSTWTPNCFYRRALKNVTIKAADGATVTIEKISADAGQIYGKADAPKYDYVLDVEIPDTNKSYYMALAWNNVKFEGINFKSSVNIESSSEKTQIDGLHFEKCNFNSGYTALAAANDPNKASKGMGIRFVSWTKTTNNLRNLTVSECTFEDCYEGVYTNPVYGVSVTNSSFNNINHNAVAIQDVDSAVNHGNVVISDNHFENVGNRIIRFNNVGDGTTITITGNTSVNSGDSAGEIIKATTMPDSVKINMTSNTWGNVNGKTAVLGNGFKPTSATIDASKYATLDDAIEAAQNGEVIVVSAGEYKLNGSLTYTGKAFTIKAAVGVKVSFDMSAAVALHGAKITFEGVTFDYKTNGNYIGIQHADTLVYNNCTINGQVFLYATNETFNGCTFNQTSADAYNVWTYGAKNVKFNGCTFNCVGRCVLVYNEGANTGTDLTVTDTTFKASAPVEGKAAIEIDTSRMTGQSKITVDKATADKTTADKTTGFATGSNSGNRLWNDKANEKASDNENVTVVVANETVYEPAIIDLDTFIKKLVASGYNFDGTLKNGGKLTVKWSPVSGCYDARTGHTCTVNGVTATGNTPKRVNSGLTQFQLFEGSNVAVTIKNVKFVYEPAAFTVCENSDWKGSFTSEQAPAGQLYFMTTGDVTVDSCEFEKVVFTTFNTTGTSTVNGCTFKDVYNSYAIKDIRGGKVSVTGTTIENCGGGIMVSSTGTVSNVTITDNKFNNVDTAGTAAADKVGTRAILQIASSGDYKSTAFVFSGNTAKSCGPVIRQLNKSVAPVGSSLKYLTEGTNSASGLYTSDSKVTYVAEVKFVDGTVEKYETLIEALKAGLSGKEGTITKLLANGTVSGVTIARIIDLNGYTLTTDDLNLDSSNGKDLIVTDSSNDKNGKLVITGSAEKMSIAHKIILKSGTIETSRTINQDYGVNNTIEINGGTLILKNGATLTNSMPRTVTINGGTIITDADESIFKAGLSTLNVKIKGGDFTQVGKLTESTSNIKFSISGGTFKADVPEEYCAKDYYPAHFNDGTKGVKKETVSTEKELRRALYEAALDGSLTRIKLTGNIKLEMLYAAENFGTEKLDDNAKGDTFNRYKLGVHPTAEDPDHWNPLVINQTQEERVVYGAYYHVSATDERIARLVIKAGQNVVIDLNGHTIEKNARATHGDWSNTCTDIIGNYGILEIKDSAETKGTIKGNGYISCNGAVLHNYEGGVMTVGAVNVDGNAAGMTAGTGQFVIANDGGKTIINGTNVHDTATSASLVVNTAGKITITGNATLNHPATKTINVKGGDVIIESATIISDKYSIYAAEGKTTITGEITVNGAGKMAVKGGEIVKTANATVGGVPEGYAWFANVDGTQSLSKAYAKIGETYYKSLADALEAANAGDTVTLLDDVTADVVINKNITLDLGGKTLTNTGAGKATISVTGGTVTVKNGTVIGGTSYYNIEVTKGSNANLTLEDITATAGNTGSSMIDNWGTMTIKSGTYTGGLNVVKSEEGSTLTINGGKFTLEYATSGYTGVIFAYGTTTITGGEFIQNLTTTGRWNHPQVILAGVVEGYTSSVIVTGGKFTNKMSGESIFRGVGKATSDNFEVSGGTFNKSISDGFCADGFIPTKNADGTYGVKEGKYVAKVGSKKYETLADAIRLAAKGKTITLLADVTEDVVITANKNITLDLGGKTLNGGTGNTKATITNYGTITITDSSAEKTGTIKRDDNGTEGETSYYVIRNLGTMTIEQANIINNSGYKKTNPSGSMVGSSLICNGDDDAYSAVLNIKGGTIRQDNFIAIKNGSSATLNVTGGKITSKHSAVQNWCNANITGGELNGQLWTDSWDSNSTGNTVMGGDAKFTGEIVIDITGSIVPKFKITGGTLDVTNWGITTAAANAGAKPAVSGGTFSSAVPEEYCADRYIPTQNADGTYGVKEAMKGSKKNPYNLEELGKMTRDQYIAAQEALGGTMYVEIGDYSYDKNGVLGNGVRNDTPGQTEDRSVLNGYNSNGYLGKNNDGANGKNIIFVGGSITSGVTGYASIDNIGTSLLLAVPAYTNVTFEGTTFNNVMSFDYQLYTGPWSQLGKLKFDNCKFNGLIVGAIAAQTLTFNGCEFTNYTNTISANNSNPTWIRPAYGNWTKGDNDGQGSDFKSLTTINFTNNTVTSTRPVKFERIAQWEMETKVTVTGNKFDIKSDGSSKNVGLYFGANAKFDLVVDNNKKTDGTAALYTAVYKAPNGTDYAGLPAGSTVKDSNGADVEVTGVIWKTTDALTLKTTTEAVEVAGVKFATLEEAFAAAKNGDTITLLEDCKSDRINLEDKSVTVVLNGKTLTSTAAYGVMFCAKNGNKITIDGTVEGSKLVGTLMITSGTDGHIEVNGGTYESNQYCPIYVNGSVSSENSTVTVKNAIIQAINSNSDQDSGCAVYLAGYSTSVFENCTITAPITGIEIRAGKLTLNNCDVTGGNGEVTKDANGNGTTVTNAALAISQHTTKKPIDVTINGGTFNGTAAVYQTDVQGTGSADVKIAVNDGTFNGTISGETDGTITISGGKFKVKVDDKYFADKLACSATPNADGYYTVKDHPIISAGISIGEDMSFRIMVEEGYENGSLKYYYIGVNGRVEGEGTIGTDTQGNSIFRIYNVNPQRADLIYVIQYYDADGNAIGAPKEISVLTYFEGFYNMEAGKNEDVEARKTFIANFLEYCAASMEKSYADFPEETLDDKTWQDRADAVRAMMNRLGLVAKDYEFKGNLGRYYNDNANGVIIERGVVFGSAFKAYYKISREAIDNGYKVFRQGMDVTDKLELVDGAYIIYFELAPYEFKDNLTITVNNGTTKVCEYTSPLANTLEMLSKSTDISLAKMAKAAFNYFVALQNYNG